MAFTKMRIISQFQAVPVDLDRNVFEALRGFVKSLCQNHVPN